MYPHPELNSYLQACNLFVPRKILNRAVYRALGDDVPYCKAKCQLTRLSSEQPQLYGPHVDVSKARCAYGDWALPKLIKELHYRDPLIVRQAVTTLGDLLVNPERLTEALNLHIIDDLTDFLISEDPYLRERVAVIFRLIAGYDVGRMEMIKNCELLLNLSRGINDQLAAVRLKVAQIIEFLAQEKKSADLLVACGFVESINVWLDHDTREIVLVHLDTLKWLFQRNVQITSVKEESFDKLLDLLDRKDDVILEKALKCLEILCEDPLMKKKAIEAKLLSILKLFFRHKVESIRIEAVRIAAFITITTEGKLCALKLNLIPTLLYMATKRNCCNYNYEALLAVLKVLTNIAEAPEGRKILLNEYIDNIKFIHVGDCELLQRHKQILLDVIYWKP